MYVLGKLTDELNDEVPVVHAAATQAMNDLGLKLSEDRSDKLTAHMKSEFADGTTSGSTCRPLRRVEPS